MIDGKKNRNWKKNFLDIIKVTLFFIIFFRDPAGKIIRPAPYQSWLTSGTVARVEPNRKWFGK